MPPIAFFATYYKQQFSFLKDFQFSFLKDFSLTVCRCVEENCYMLIVVLLASHVFASFLKDAT